MNSLRTVLSLYFIPRIKYFKQGSDELKSGRSQDGTLWLCGGEGRQL